MEVYSQLPSQDKAIFKVQIGILWLYTIKVRVFFRNGIFLAFFGNLFQYLIFLTVNLSFFFKFYLIRTSPLAVGLLHLVLLLCSFEKNLTPSL